MTPVPGREERWKMEVNIKGMIERFGWVTKYRMGNNTTRLKLHRFILTGRVAWCFRASVWELWANWHSCFAYVCSIHLSCRHDQDNLLKFKQSIRMEKNGDLRLLENQIFSGRLSTLLIASDQICVSRHNQPICMDCFDNRCIKNNNLTLQISALSSCSAELVYIVIVIAGFNLVQILYEYFQHFCHWI